MSLVVTPKNCDTSVKKAIQQIARKLGAQGSPTHAGLTLTGLTASSLVGTNASKLLESVTIGLGLDYTRPTLKLSHLGIQDLTDPGADKILFWDDSATAWLGVGNSIAITTTTIDTIQDIRTSASPQFTGIELGHATDTTITRASAGNLNIEGNLIYRAGGTDVPLTDGGTGQSTAQLAINALTAVGAATNEHVLTKDTATGNAIFKAAAGGGGFDIDALDALGSTSLDTTVDYYAIYDDSAAVNKKVLVPSLLKIETGDRTVNVDSSMTTAEIQTEIDSIGKFIMPGVTITLQFADGTYTITDNLFIGGFIGGGLLRILGNTGEANATDLHTSQAVYINSSATNCHGFWLDSNLVRVDVYNFKIYAQTTSNKACIYVNRCMFAEVRYNYCLGDGTALGQGIYTDASNVSTYKNYVSNMKYGIYARYSLLASNTNDETGTDPLYGLVAVNAATIGKVSTQPTGSTANELVQTGGEIRA